MNKKEHKVKIATNAEVKSTQTKMGLVFKKLPLFIVVMGVSFALTVVVVRSIPKIVLKAKQIKLPSFTSLWNKEGNNAIIFSGNENFTTMDPMLLKEHMDAKTKKIILIDTRSQAEFENGHIKGAYNIALYLDFRSPYRSVVDIKKWVREVDKKGWGASEIILYGFNADADIVKVGAEALRKRGMRVKILSIGYSEWQGSIWNWIAGGDLNGTLNINDYIERK